MTSFPKISDRFTRGANVGNPAILLLVVLVLGVERAGEAVV